MLPRWVVCEPPAGAVCTTYYSLGLWLMIPGLRQKRLARVLIVMTILVGVFGMFLRLVSRCEPDVLRSLNLTNIASCAMLRGEEGK